RLLGAPEPMVSEGAAQLCGRGLAWDNAGVVRLLERLEEHWRAEIGGGRPVAKITGSVSAENLRVALAALGGAAEGLRKPELAARLSELVMDLPMLVKVISELPGPVRDRLRAYRSGYPDYYAARVGRRPGDPDPTQQLIAAGLLLPVNYGLELPREVAVASWLADRAPTLTGRPVIPPAGADESAVRRAAQAAAQGALRSVTTLLDEARAAPIAALKKGGVGPRERTRLAKRLLIPEDVLVLWIDLAYAAGLLGQVESGYAPTPSYTEWREQVPARRWAVLAEAWFVLEHAPTSRETPDDKELPPPLPLGSHAGMMRRALLGAAGSGASVRAVGEEIDWFFPLHGYDAASRARKVAAAIREAELLGVLAEDMMSELGEHLLAAAAATEPGGAAEELSRRCAELLPETPCSVILQSDLTAVIAGQPSAAVSRLLNDTAITETSGAARTWRFTPASVRAALDAGWNAQDLLAQLAAVSASPVPQPLEYLIIDVARRHGQVRVRGMRSCVIADEVLITEMLHTRSLAKLHLSRLAPTVLSSPCGLDDLLARLREAGFSPMAEDAQGTVIVEARHDHQAPAHSRVIIAQPRPTLSATALAHRLISDPHGVSGSPPVDSAIFELLSQLNSSLDEAELELLSDAVEHHNDVVITYRDKNGSRSTRAIRPNQLYGKWLDSWCHLRNAQRDFTIANIEAVSPAS
ncbi:MAG TPA: helicase-associated domain-containing protein, partial [Pseudonocardiaceae bacterium]|nr:helicase-associated domain-containing protein [Pseudonocardiaceae bacterium]